MVWGEKGDPGSLPGRLRTKEPLVPVKELGHSGLIISFHTDYWVLKVQGVRRCFVTNIKKKKKKLAKPISFSQKLLHFVNRVFQHVGRAFPSAHEVLLNLPWPQCRISQGTTRCSAACTAPAAGRQLAAREVRAASVCATRCWTDQVCAWSLVDLLHCW